MTVRRIQLRRGTSAQWAAANPILSSGEPGFDTDLRLLKIGDGTTAWAALDAIEVSEDITAEEIGLGNVDNTSDINKPISTATQTVLTALSSEIAAGAEIVAEHRANFEPHGSTSDAVGGRMPVRNSAGTFSVGPPTSASHPARLTDMETADSTVLSTALSAVEGRLALLGFGTPIGGMVLTQEGDLPPPVQPADGKAYIWIVTPAEEA